MHYFSISQNKTYNIPITSILHRDKSIRPNKMNTMKIFRPSYTSTLHKYFHEKLNSKRSSTL